MVHSRSSLPELVPSYGALFVARRPTIEFLFYLGILAYVLGYSSSESLVTFGLEKYPRSFCIASMCLWF